MQTHPNFHSKRYPKVICVGTDDEGHKIYFDDDSERYSYEDGTPLVDVNRACDAAEPSEPFKSYWGRPFTNKERLQMGWRD